MRTGACCWLAEALRVNRTYEIAGQIRHDGPCRRIRTLVADAQQMRAFGSACQWQTQISPHQCCATNLKSLSTSEHLVDDTLNT